MDRFTKADTPLGRWRLNLKEKWKRFTWNAVVGGTLFIKRSLDITLAITAIILLSSLYLVIAIYGKLDGGPIKFGQT